MQKKQVEDFENRSKSKQNSRKKLSQIRMHIKTEKEISHQTNIIKLATPTNKLFVDKYATQAQTTVLRNLQQIRQISLQRGSKHSQSFKSKKSKLPELFQKSLKLMEISQCRQNSLPKVAETKFAIREQVSVSTLQKRKGECFRRAHPSKSLKIPFKELIPIKEITREQKIQNLKLIRMQFQSLINSSNNITVRNQELNFKAFVEKGNNGILIKELLKKRWWWHLEEKDPSKANLIWTEWFNKAATNNMPISNNESLKTCEIDYSQNTSSLDPKLYSIKMLVDQNTFSKVKQKISLNNVNYFKTAKLKSLRANNSPDQLINISLSGQSHKEISLESTNIIHNHIDGCLQLHSKKLLFKNFSLFLKKKDWDPIMFIPLTFYIDNAESPSLKELMNKYDQIQTQKVNGNIKNVWIVKPGQNSNRGFGITVHNNRESLKEQISKRLTKNQENSGCNRSIIVQKYIQDCFLINRRKFDLRCYILITTVNGILKGYWYNDGYIRTSSQEYSLENMNDLMVHLTNDAVQKKNSSYGKYQDFNKMSFFSFRKYLIKNGYAQTKFSEAYEQMKLIAYYLIASVSSKIKRKQYTFELFGLDFMFDADLKPLLIEANSNPCLDTSGVILGKLIPELIDNVLMTTVDPLFPPPLQTIDDSENRASKENKALRRTTFSRTNSSSFSRIILSIKRIFNLRDVLDVNNLIFRLYQLQQQSNWEMMSNGNYGNGQTIFSLRNILENQIDPHVCKQLLHEIKSPLMEQSFQLTNDNSRNMSTSEIPRRPNIPPAPKSPPGRHFATHQFSRSHQSMDVSIYENLDKYHQIDKWKDVEYIESIVSPLHPQITLNQPVRKRQVRDSPILCGAFNSIFQKQNQIQVQVPVRDSNNTKRRKIFQKLQAPEFVIVHPKNNKQAKSFSMPNKIDFSNARTLQNTIQKLHSIKEIELANFLTLLNDLIFQLRDLKTKTAKIQESSYTIFQVMSRESNYIPDVNALNETHERILKRLQAKNTYEALQQCSKNFIPNGSLSNISDLKILEEYFTVFNNIEKIITNYLNVPNSLLSLKIIYRFFHENYQTSQNFFDQIEQCLKSLNVCDLETQSLQLCQYIWKQGRSRLLSQQEFIFGLCENDYIYTQANKDYENDLQEKGFQRNS